MQPFAPCNLPETGPAEVARCLHSRIRSPNEMYEVGVILAGGGDSEVVNVLLPRILPQFMEGL